MAHPEARHLQHGGAAGELARLRHLARQHVDAQAQRGQVFTRRQELEPVLVRQVGRHPPPRRDVQAKLVRLGLGASAKLLRKIRWRGPPLLTRYAMQYRPSLSR